jgi:16S rRNA processing protein RimM
MSHVETTKLVAGNVTGTHGLKGDLKVRPHTNRTGLLLEAQTIFFRCPKEKVFAYESVCVTPHKKGVILRLKGLSDIDAVQHLVGCEILIDVNDLAEDEESEATVFKLIGMSVADRSRGELGTIEEILTTAAHDILVVDGPFGEVLIPAINEFITEIKHPEKRLLVDLPDGLVPEVNEV